MSHSPLEIMQRGYPSTPTSAPVASLPSNSCTSSQTDAHMTLSMRKRPDFSVALDLIGRTDTDRAERAMLLAAVRWCNFKTGIIFVSVEKWAGLAGVHDRTGQRALQSLVAKGHLSVVKPSRGGPRQTTHYRVECIMTKDEPSVRDSPSVTPTHAAVTPAIVTHNPGTSDTKPRSHATGTTNEQPMEQPTTHDVVVQSAWKKLMGSTDLLHHPNATAERVRWILKEVGANARIKNKQSWAATAINDAFTVPESHSKPRRMMKPGTAEVN
jgi:hypothetical protein